MNHRWRLPGKSLAVIASLSIWFPLFPAFGAVSVLKSGDLELSVSSSGSGISFEHLLDRREQRDLLSAPASPLFTIVLRRVGSSEDVVLRSDAGWARCNVRSRSRSLELTWNEPARVGLESLSVKIAARADENAGAFRWKLHVAGCGTNWTVWRVAFPELALAKPGDDGVVFFPRGPGEVQADPWSRAFEYRGNYPDGWCAMQFVAAYAEGKTGLYVGMHDPWGSTKGLTIKSDPEARALRIGFEHPAPDMGIGGNGFALEGEAVWQLLRGDWFDAAGTYRSWARKQAKWWPRLGRDGRADTPRWMRELNVWAMTGGAPGECVSRVSDFRRFLDLHLGFHWYNWHQIPFDNDYPHYFPARAGFEQGVRSLKSAGVFPMPYINGRLWDSRDSGAEDLEFSRLALPAVTKKEDGSPWLETYGSKETNGEPVRLGVMCPGTMLWRNTVSNIVLRLLRECGTSGVYIDQVAAAAPKLCMDPSHGHPLGGGHWWTESYWKMLGDIRGAMPPGCMLTTECNAEPFIRWFDGYLTWHWQHDGQVPAFPAVYGGTVQMFGRAYRGGATKDLALRMKAAQQLVFGEQLGWLDPGVMKELENAVFFRELAQVRANFNRFFYAGEMARPPKLIGDVPKAKADWQWSGEWWVTTDAVLTGAWRLPKERRLLLLFVNVADQTVTASVKDNGSNWGLPKAGLRLQLTCSGATRVLGNSGAMALPAAGTRFAASDFKAPVAFRPRGVQAWEFSW